MRPWIRSRLGLCCFLLMLRIDRAAIERLPAERREEARALLATYEERVRANPLLAYVPHRKQVVFHGSNEPLKVFLGGNRSGKTTAGICDDVIQAVDRDCLPESLRAFKKWDAPFYCRIIVPDFTSTLEGVIFQKLREWTPRAQLVGGGFDKAYDKARRRLHFENGSWFDFLTFEQDLDKFGGAALHRVHYDEEPPAAIRRESTMRLIDYGGDELFTMTPLQGMSWMYDAIWEPWTKGRLDEATVVLVDMDDNPHLDERTKRRALAGLSHEERQARKSGRFVHFAGMIYDDFSRNEHVVPEVSELPRDVRVFVGIDPGMRHMAAVLWVYLTADDRMVVFDELALQGHTVKQVAEAIHLRNQRWGREIDGRIVPLQPAWYVIDPAARNVVHQTGRSDQMEFTDHGIVTILGQNSVTAGINRVKERLQAHRLVVAANCQTMIDQFRKYRWASPSRTESDPKEKPVKSDDHLLDALRYVVMSRPAAPELEETSEQLSPLERAARRHQHGRRRRQIPKTPMGGIFA
jgi:phage terminase large subunit-like protein